MTAPSSSNVLSRFLCNRNYGKRNFGCKYAYRPKIYTPFRQHRLDRKGANRRTKSLNDFAFPRYRWFTTTFATTLTSSSRLGQIQYKHQLQRHFATHLYACGEGWTGAFGKEHLRTSVVGHYDEEEEIEEGLEFDENDNLTDVQNEIGSNSSNSNEDGLHWNRRRPSSVQLVPIYDGDDVKQVSVGWATTAFVNTQGQVYIVGRPHDLMSMLRMARIPQMIRNFIIARTNGSGDERTNENRGDFVEATLVGKWVSDLIGWATGTSAAVVDPDIADDLDPKDKVWAVAQEYSWLKNWTKIDLRKMSQQNITRDTQFNAVACGPGITALIGKDSGTLYMMGVNNRGQCGIGQVSNNVWIPEPVKGISSRPSSSGRSSSSSTATSLNQQDVPIVQVALGFQHGVALTQDGQVYTWGKANRGQLGRPLRDNDQDAVARPIKIPSSKSSSSRGQQSSQTSSSSFAVQISSGHHHGALLTDDNRVFVWGKNMSRGMTESEDDNNNSSSNKPADAMTPEQVVGLPSMDFDELGIHKKVLQISCGSHHTAILLEDGSVHAVGIASDEAVPILNPVELIPPGIVQMPVRFFEAHFDRTTVIDRDGHVYQAHLWNDEMLREFSYFTPTFVKKLQDYGEDIQAIHRGWKHTIVVSSSAAT